MNRSRSVMFAVLAFLVLPMLAPSAIGGAPSARAQVIPAPALAPGRAAPAHTLPGVLEELAPTLPGRPFGPTPTAPPLQEVPMPMNGTPLADVYDSVNDFVYVVTSYGETYNLTVLDDSTIVGSIPTSYSALPVVDPGNGLVYVPNKDGVEVLNGTTSMGNLTTLGPVDPYAPLPFTFTFNSSDGLAFVANYWTGNVTVLDGTTIVATIPTGIAAADLAYDPADGDVYVGNQYGSNVSVINATTVLATIAVGSGPETIAYDPVDKTVYAANLFSDNLSEIRGLRAIGSLSLPTPTGYYEKTYYNISAVDPVTGDLYLTLGWDTNYGLLVNSSAVVSNMSISWLPAIDAPTTFVFDSALSCFYGTRLDESRSSYNSNYTLYVNVTEVCGNTTRASFSLGVYPNGWAALPSLTYDSATQELAVVDSGGNVSGCVGCRAYVQNNLTLLYGGTHYTPPPVIASFTANPDPVGLGGSFLLNVSANGSGNPLTYSYSGLPSGCASVNASTLTCVATLSSGYRVLAKVENPEGRSASAHVEVHVQHLNISSFVATPPVVEVGSTTDGSTTLVVTVSTPGAATMNYSYSGLPPGCASANVSSLTCTPHSNNNVAWANGTGVPYSVTVHVIDGAGNRGNATTVLTVEPALIAEPSVSYNRTNAGVPLQFGSGAAGGVGPYAFAWLFGDGARSNLSAPVHAYSTRGGYTVDLWVNDSGSDSVFNTLAITVYPALVVVLTSSNDTPALGESILLSTNVTGGLAPYSYAYQGLPPGCVPVDGPTIGCLPTQTGFYILTAIATDADAQSVNATLALHVLFDFTVLAPAQAIVGQPFALVVHPDGGYAGLVFEYAGLPAGCASVDGPELSCTPNALGSFVITITVTDQAVHRATHAVTVRVVAGVASASPPWPPWLGGPTLLAAGLVGIAAIAVAIYGLRRRAPPLPPASTVAPPGVGRPPPS